MRLKKQATSSSGQGKLKENKNKTKAVERVGSSPYSRRKHGHEGIHRVAENAFIEPRECAISKSRRLRGHLLPHVRLESEQEALRHQTSPCRYKYFLVESALLLPSTSFWISQHLLLELLHESHSRTHILDYRFQSFFAWKLNSSKSFWSFSLAKALDDKLTFH